jgi:hypoxanthine phosphoribosyltransferase
MERFPKFKERGLEGQEMVRGLEKSFIALCLEMKEKIDSGAYDALVSDETGGRIPTLIFKEIFKKVNPDKEFKTLFVASGKRYHPKSPAEEKAMRDYLKKGLDESKTILLVTQYIHSGKSINRLAEELKSIGVENIDVSTIDINKMEAEEGSPVIRNLYIGGIKDKRQFDLTENSNVSSGISKKKLFNPQPMRLDKALDQGERSRLEYMNISKEDDKFFGIEPYDGFYERREKRRDADVKFDELDSTPLSDEEKRQIQENINNTRQVIKEVSDKVFTEVWGNKHD